MHATTRPPRAAPRLRYRMEALGFQLLSGVFCLLPHAAAVHLGDFLGRFVARFRPIRGAEAAENIAASFPERTPAERRRILHGFYRHAGRMLAEFLRSPVMTPAEIARFTTLENETALRTLYEKGRGVMVVSAHFGNWEWLAATAAARGYDTDVLVAPQRNRLVQEFITRCRARLGVHVLLTKRHKGDLRQVFRSLRRGRLIGTLVDQDGGRAGHFIDFLGRPASAAIGLYRIALRTGVPVVIAFTWREGMHHHFHVEPPLVLDPSLDEESQARRWAEEFHHRLAAHITAHPEQWFWVHRRWRSRPLSGQH